ncbi:MAG TPA: hypothetical protein VI758_10800 [Bacteroidota bacterium]
MRLGLAFVCISATIVSAQQRPGSLVNFAHLDHLTEQIRLNGEQVSIVHIYADYPSYKWVDAGDEGIACVDDVARAAVVYLTSYEQNQDTLALSRARLLLKFIMSMQTEDGQFYNFLRADHSINRDGKTSLKSFGWWAGRALWAMSTGCRVMNSVDPAFASVLRKRVERSLPNVGHLLDKFGKTTELEGFKCPDWLMYDSGADATTELLLGLIEYYRASQDKIVAGYVRQLSDGLMIMQDGTLRVFPFGAHRSWQSMWHAWGNSQTEVLAYAGTILSDSSMIRSAELEARGFYSRLLINGMAKEWNFAMPAARTDYEQIAYGIRPMTLGLLRLYDATQNNLYLRMAGLAASWFFGNNVLNAVMYDSTTGRCFDGITDSTHVNRNSGAESTIEALYTLLELERYPLAQKYLHYKKLNSVVGGDQLSATFQNDSGAQLTLKLDVKNETLSSREQESCH